MVGTGPQAPASLFRAAASGPSLEDGLLPPLPACGLLPSAQRPCLEKNITSFFSFNFINQNKKLFLASLGVFALG